MADTDHGLHASAGILCWTGQVGPADLDENGHMNVRSYDRVLEEADMAFFYTMGWTPDYLQVEQKGFFRVEKHVRYRAELLLDAPLLATAWLIDADLRRFQLFFQLWNGHTKTRAATMETLLLHMDLTTRRPAAMQQGAQAQNWLSLQHDQAGTPPPPGTGRKVSFDKQD